MIINTPSRLHLTLIDLNGSCGRIDGGVGITIQDPELILMVEIADYKNNGIKIHFNDSENLSENLISDYSQKIKKSAINTLKYFNIDSSFDFFVEKSYPAHAGLGSGTQLSLATAKLITELNGLEVEPATLGHIVGRGGTSGIGVGAFHHGGFIVDGGHSKNEKSDFLPSSASSASPPPLLAHYDFPEDWDIVLAIPNLQEGVSGKKEVNIFQKYCPIPLSEVQELSHLILMKMMPAILEKDISTFGDSINQIQTIGFKKREMELQDKLIGDILNTMRDAGASGAGMSSFGPTLFAVTQDNSKDVLKAVEESMSGYEGISIITRAQNTGAKMKKD
jgi:beta-ribofuranosylaminobenzene 5'-phosphate synthase